MKKLLVSVSILSVLLIAGTDHKARAQDVTVSFQMFYDNLAPYGQWVYDPEYGNVWVPNEEGDFRPYGSRGYWAMTDYGNTWVTDDPWGWAVYHYGRWTYDPYYGWIWVPGYEWAPAWVSWRYGNGYCGWAPLGPRVSITMGYNCPESWWVFVQPNYMYQRDCIRYWRGPSYNRTYVSQTTIINNYYVDNTTRVRYNYGPRREQVERITRQPVQVYSLSRTSRPGAPVVSGNRVNVYRPTIDRNSLNSSRPQQVMQAPRQISRHLQPATNIERGRQPEFRQEMQRQNPGQRQEQRYQPPAERQQQQRYQPQPDRQMRRDQQPVNRPDMQRNQPTMERNQQQRNFEPQRQQQPDRMEQQRAVEQQRQQQMDRDRQQQQRVVEQQRQQQADRDRQQQQRAAEPQRQQRNVEQPRPQMNRPEPQQQQQQYRPAPAPAPAPAPRQAPMQQRRDNDGGGRR